MALSQNAIDALKYHLLQAADRKRKVEYQLRKAHADLEALHRQLRFIEADMESLQNDLADVPDLAPDDVA